VSVYVFQDFTFFIFFRVIECVENERACYPALYEKARLPGG
jgi:hypothetical protein